MTKEFKTFTEAEAEIRNLRNALMDAIVTFEISNQTSFRENYKPLIDRARDQILRDTP